MPFERVIYQIVSTRRDNYDEILTFELGLEMTLKPEVQDLFLYRDFQRSIHDRNFKCDTNVPPGHSLMKYLDI